jgi:hypothetical protein
MATYIWHHWETQFLPSLEAIPNMPFYSSAIPKTITDNSKNLAVESLSKVLKAPLCTIRLSLYSAAPQLHTTLPVFFATPDLQPSSSTTHSLAQLPGSMHNPML